MPCPCALFATLLHIRFAVLFGKRGSSSLDVIKDAEKRSIFAEVTVAGSVASAAKTNSSAKAVVVQEGLNNSSHLKDSSGQTRSTINQEVLTSQAPAHHTHSVTRHVMSWQRGRAHSAAHLKISGQISEEIFLTRRGFLLNPFSSLFSGAALCSAIVAGVLICVIICFCRSRQSAGNDSDSDSDYDMVHHNDGQIFRVQIKKSDEEKLGLGVNYASGERLTVESIAQARTSACHT